MVINTTWGDIIMEQKLTNKLTILLFVFVTLLFVVFSFATTTVYAEVTSNTTIKDSSKQKTSNMVFSENDDFVNLNDRMENKLRLRWLHE